MFSILIATYNQLDYLKICLGSIKKNSKFTHQIIIHVNEGTDGTLEFLKKIIMSIRIVKRMMVFVCHIIKHQN